MPELDIIPKYLTKILYKYVNNEIKKQGAKTITIFS